jgi:hypothetical protein
VTDLADMVTDAVKSGSPVDRLRKRRAELEAGVLLDIEIPGYEGVLVARYKRLTPEQLNAALADGAATAGKSADAQLVAAADIVTRHVLEVTFREPDGTYIPLDPDDAEPMRFDDRLARIMNFPIPDDWNPRVVLMGLVVRGNESGIAGMARSLIEWSSGLTQGARETLQGESRATLP